jgi:hypothetical protein
MMSYEQWLGSILEVARETASRHFQQEAWLSGRPSTSSPTEIYNELFDDYSFDEFFKAHAERMTAQQKTAWLTFKDKLEKYLPKLQRGLNEREVFEDPDWELVRESAARFVEAFEQ